MSGAIYDPTRGECFIAGTLIGAASGVLIGMVAGAFVRTERWEEVSFDPEW